MALLTFLFGNRCMHRIVQDSVFVGTVRVMAGVTAAAGHVIIHMSSDKKGAIGFMALFAQAGHFIF